MYRMIVNLTDGQSTRHQVLLTDAHRDVLHAWQLAEGQCVGPPAACISPGVLFLLLLVRSDSSFLQPPTGMPVTLGSLSPDRPGEPAEPRQRLASLVIHDCLSPVSRACTGHL